jgi:ABC-type dipeptide/oligopeptide/nickel transport system permease subunit
MSESALKERFRRDRFLQLGLVVVGAMVLAAIFAPWLAPHNPITGDLKGAYLISPGSRFLLGTDTQGRDVLSRVLYGARLSLSVGLISQTVSVTVGVLLGLLAGYYGRWVDALVMRFADITLAFPTLLLLIAVAAAVKPSLPVVFVVIGLVGWAGMARLVRSQVLVLRQSEFVQAAQALGARDRRVLLRHLLPNVRTQVIIAATLGIAGAIMAEAALSFVGSLRPRAGVRWWPMGETCSGLHPGSRSLPALRSGRPCWVSTWSVTRSGKLMTRSSGARDRV